MVSIITVNYNQTALTCALLDSLRLQDYQDIEVIVVDNGSRENGFHQFEEHFPGNIYIRSDENLGFAGGNNLGVSVAKGEYLFFVNNDAEVTNTCISVLVEILQSDNRIGMVSPLICYFPEHEEQKENPVIQYAGMPRVNSFTGRSKMQGKGMVNSGQFDAPFQTGYAHGAAMMIPRTVFDKVGPMAEDYFLYYEEIDWCERIRKAGYDILVVPKAVVWHKESSTMKSLGQQKTYYMARNRIWFMKRHYSGWPFFVFSVFSIFVVTPKQLLIHMFKGELRNLWAFLKGVMHGFLRIHRVTQSHPVNTRRAAKHKFK